MSIKSGRERCGGISGGLPGTSQIEIQLRHEVGAFFRTEHDKQSRVFVSDDGRRYEADIILPEERIAIEYDSYKYHQGNVRLKADRLKSTILESNGYVVIRVRERPLEAVGPNDVEVPSNVTSHKVAIIVMRRIGEIMERQGIPMSTRQERRVKMYCQDGVLVANGEADARIDEIRRARGPVARAARAQALTTLLGSGEWRRANGN